MTEKMPKEEFEKRTMEHRKGMIYVIKGLKVSREELGVITRRAKQAEFTGTTFMPLPTESDLVKIARQVQERCCIRDLARADTSLQRSILS